MNRRYRQPVTTSSKANVDADSNGRGRIGLLDIWKGVAIAGVVVFHFAWDLEAFGLAPRGMTLRPEWVYFARSLAGSFMLLVGMSLFLAHNRTIRWAAFTRRLAVLVAAALTISMLTYFITPDAFIYFGILHSIAVSSVLGLLFVRVPPPLTAAFGVIVLFGRGVLSSDFFNAPVWYWTGLSTIIPPSNDYEPMFPWFGLVLLGIAAAKAAAQTGLLQKLGRLRVEQPPLAFVSRTGRHTLMIYLLHQPILFGGFYLAFYVL